MLPNAYLGPVVVAGAAAVATAEKDEAAVEEGAVKESARTAGACMRAKMPRL